MSIERRLLKYVTLNMLAMIGTSCYILADTFFISMAEGADGITALNLALPLYGLIFALGSMTGTGSATRYGIARACGDKNRDSYFFNAVFFVLLLSIPFILLGILRPELVLKVMGGDEGIMRLGKGYIRFVLLFTPCFMLNYVSNAFVRNDNDPTLAMSATLISSFSNIVLDYVFMFPLGMGMRGAALATGLSPVINIAVCSLHFLSEKNQIRFCPQFPSLKKIAGACQLGVSAFVGEISSGITTTVFNFLLLALAGNTGVAAYGVIANASLVGISVFNGIAQGAQPLASEAYGKKNHRSQKKVLLYSLAIAVVMALLIMGMIQVSAEGFVKIFNSDHSVQLAAYAVPGIRIYFIGFLFAGMNIVTTGCLSAVDQAVPAFVIAISRGMLAIVGFAVLLSRIWGVNGVWCSFLAAELFTMGISLGVLLHLYRKKAA